MSQPLSSENPRTARLSKLFKDVLSGKQVLNTPQNGNLFIEAICARPDPAASLFEIVSSEGGLKSVQACMRLSLSTSFLNGAAGDILTFLREPELKSICEGDLLRQVIICIVKPPIFWNAFVKAYREGSLQDATVQSFAWLLMELLKLPAEQSSEYRELARELTRQEELLNSSQFDTRIIGQKIKHILSALDSSHQPDGSDAPGGRHDNDHVDFRQISLFPTADELTSTELPFLLTADDLEDPKRSDSRLAQHLENHFRLLREDMLGDMREELQIVLGKKKGNHRGLIINHLALIGMDCGLDTKAQLWSMKFQCNSDIPGLFRCKPEDRKTYLSDNRNVFRHQSQTCLIVDGVVTAFPKINRNEDLLAAKPPVLVLQFEDEADNTKVLLGLKAAKQISLVQIDTAVFSYAPVLRRLQDSKELPLYENLVSWSLSCPMPYPAGRPLGIIADLEANLGAELKDVLQTSKSVQLDASQSRCLLSGLTESVSLIQGPPGTGKSFIGALITKILHDVTKKTILVVCYTNHALDQFLEDLLDIGIPPARMVRLGGKSTLRTKPLALFEQSTNFKRSRDAWTLISALKSKLTLAKNQLNKVFAEYQQSTVTKPDLIQYLEFPPEDSAFFEAFAVPETSNGMKRVGRKGKVVSRFYLLDRWSQGMDAGAFRGDVSGDCRRIWKMDHSARQGKLAEWKSDILEEQASALNRNIKLYNESVRQLEVLFNDKTPRILENKRIIGCTTTAAAMYVKDLQTASPDVLLVEEAGEILESHIITAMGPKTSQLVLIGDHKQLRPKVQNYRLSVEKNEGYDLNRSLFERLVLKGFPHEVLTKQHRMRPEISSFIREMTYPDLVDAPKTLGRPDLRGFQDNVVFVNHTSPEDDLPEITDRRDLGSVSSKQNSFEGYMVLKCVRYLAQQGYGQGKLVVLTPYLGQLYLLQKLLREENDPILNDLDTYDLVQAGLLPAASSKLTKSPVRLATIDNYQGEESDIVIVSMTRSNKSRDIGFMGSPERLNVLLSRARDAFIMIGNAAHFINARKGKEIWTKFFEILKRKGNIYEGFPVKCERHPDRTATLKSAKEFDEECPDGGCKEACGTVLNCGLHACPYKCHQLSDHSKMPCDHVLDSKCSKGHTLSWKCHKRRPLTCAKCDQEAQALKRKQEKAFELQQKRDAEQREHAKRMASLEEELDRQVQLLKDSRLSKERRDAIEQKKADLAAAVGRTSKDSEQTKSLDLSNASAITSVIGTVAQAFGNLLPPSRSEELSTNKSPSTEDIESASQVSPPPSPPHTHEKPQPEETPPQSASAEDWRRQKEIENASNEALDSLMELTGLEAVKSQMLAIKSKIDTSARQNTDVKGERFNAAFVGNPGTGKTTVARLYAKFLTLVEILPGDAFVETNGSRLANGGVSTITKHIEEIQAAGGGALFVDEAYQLTSGHNPGGVSVLDFLLAEMENQIGKIVFIFAGYNKEMESFFKHNPGLNRRIPYTLKFEDYENNELQEMLKKLIQKKYNGKMKVEGGLGGLFFRIVIKRLGRGRNRVGFGNVGELQNVFSKISERQAERLDRERRAGYRPDDLLLTKEDLIGPNPSRAIVQSKAWEKLQSLIGLNAVKESVKSMIGSIETNYLRELREKDPVQLPLNKVFLGSPGTGKTSVAKLYGRILADLGMLSNGEGKVVTKNPADFIGSHLGQSEANTKGILETTVGKVLIVDEAYMLYSGNTGTGSQGDPYKTAVIDTIVAEVQNTPGDNRCVLLLGYEDQIKEMFRNVNPGLSRRFPIENSFRFDDLSDSQLRQILELKLKEQDLDATDRAKSVAIDVLSRARNQSNFGNAGEVENLLGKAKASYQSRLSSGIASERSLDVVFEAQDFDSDFDRERGAATNLQKLFEDVVGCESVIAKLDEFQQVARNMKNRGLEPRDQIPTNFIFRGPPGTGKTTTARKMGKVFYDMGFLSSAEVIECSASDLIAQYIGQTGPKTRAQLEKALGKVIFIDEAYRLGEGHFASEAIDELVDIITKPKFFGKVIVILAGYDDDMRKLLAVNSGLSSRFSEEVVFRDMSPESCMELLKTTLQRQKIGVEVLQDQGSALHHEMSNLIEELSRLKFWGNARDVQTLAKSMVSAALKATTSSTSPLAVTSQEALNCIKVMLAERQDRCATLPSQKRPQLGEAAARLPDTLPSTPPLTRTRQIVEKTSGTEETKSILTQRADERDPGVSDESWSELQAAKEASARATKMAQIAIAASQQKLETAREMEKVKAEQSSALVLAETKAANDAEMNEVKRKRERARLEEATAEREREEAEADLKRIECEEAERRKQEAQAQAKLQQMGVCCMGFRWIKRDSGYQCAGGSHFVSNGQLGL
ncbi:MAG: hypothetical protein M4579_004161 [Chaenotheca gracillima]|nr:MAG: hypothetical protein M4579_004161 [Chaenotheca gracillima]